MSISRASRAALAVFALAVSGLPATAQSIVQNVGDTQALYTGPASPRAVVFMFAGGDGMVGFNTAGQITRMNANFLTRTEPLWLAQGLGFATLASSSSLLDRRHTPGYAQTIAAGIDFVRARTGGTPIWLVGTSMGSIAAANGAAHLPGRAAGAVLTSSVAAPSRAVRETVFDSDLGAIAVPTLIVANRGDTCPSAGPSFAPQILAALSRAPRKEIIYVESHQLQSEPCEALSPHGYLGIEADVVRQVANWIDAASAR